jgi:arylsulfatase
MPQLGIRATKPTPPAETVNRAVLDLVGRCAGGPCFVFANYMDAHLPYTPAPPYAGRWALRRGEGRRLEQEAALHDEAITGLDAAIGQLLEQLASSDSLAHWWIVITADHGEAFGEHGYTRHGKGLHVEQTKVPLMIVPPRTDRLTARQDAVSLIDVATTIAGLGGVEGFGEGDDLRRPVSAARPARMVSSGRADIPPSRAVVVGRRQLIEWADRRELYDLEADRAQQHDLAAAAPDEVERLRALLPPGVMDKGEAVRAGDDEAPLDEVDDATRRNLRALGYLD